MSKQDKQQTTATEKSRLWERLPLVIFHFALAIAAAVVVGIYLKSITLAILAGMFGFLLLYLEHPETRTTVITWILCRFGSVIVALVWTTMHMQTILHRKWSVPILVGIFVVGLGIYILIFAMDKQLALWFNLQEMALFSFLCPLHMLLYAFLHGVCKIPRIGLSIVLGILFIIIGLAQAYRIETKKDI